jgi:alpha-tubulin suppressor-like RCC1 family protein
MPDQTVWCWGLNATGQLGTGDTRDSLVPQWVRTLPPATGVSAGHDHTCAAGAAGQVWCWGANAFGELGNGTTSVDHPLPVLVQGIVAAQVSAGDGFTCAVTMAHTADCWGDNNFGELGNGTTADSAVPAKVGIEGAAFVAAGSDDSCAILASGALSCWGSNDAGQLGTGDTADHHVPTLVAALTSGVQQATMGLDFSCALADIPVPTAVCWGDEDGHGQLGNGHASGDLTVPARVFGLTTSAAGGASGPQQLAAGSHHACAVMTTGVLPCRGQFAGDGSSETTVHTSATQVTGLPANGVSQVSAGWGGCALVRLGGLAARRCSPARSSAGAATPWASWATAPPPTVAHPCRFRARRFWQSPPRNRMVRAWEQM